MVRAGCLAHVRRKFNDALKLDPQDREAAAVLLLMGKLYAVEKEAREAGATHEQRLAMRQQRSVALFEELKAKITQIASACFAIEQTRRSLPIRPQPVDTAEALSPKRPHRDRSEPLRECHASAWQLGRKNWLHIGSPEAGPKIAAILSVMETCKRLQINLRKYLNDVLPKLPSWPN